MTYRNKKSGVMFTTSCVCGGEDWEEVKASTPTPKMRDEKKQESADAQSGDSGGESREEAKASASVSKVKKGKKQEPAADSGGEDS